MPWVEVEGFRVSGFPGFWGFGVWGFRASRAWGFRRFGVSRFLGVVGASGFQGFGVSGEGSGEGNRASRVLDLQAPRWCS